MTNIKLSIFFFYIICIDKGSNVWQTQRVKYNRKRLLKYLSIETRLAVKNEFHELQIKNNSANKTSSFQMDERIFCYHNTVTEWEQTSKNMMNWWDLLLFITFICQLFFVFFTLGIKKNKHGKRQGYLFI